MTGVTVRHRGRFPTSVLVASPLALLLLAFVAGTAAGHSTGRLTDPAVSPNPAVAGSPVSFGVTFSDATGSAPRSVVVMVDSQSTTMSGSGADYGAGVRFSARTEPAVGWHHVEFVAVDAGGDPLALWWAGTLHVMPGPGSSPTPEPIATPTPAPTAKPTPVPTAQPTPAPTAKPIPTRTSEPPVNPTPTRSPSATPQPAPSGGSSGASATPTPGVAGGTPGAQPTNQANGTDPAAGGVTPANSPGPAAGAGTDAGSGSRDSEGGGAGGGDGSGPGQGPGTSVDPITAIRAAGSFVGKVAVDHFALGASEGFRSSLPSDPRGYSTLTIEQLVLDLAPTIATASACGTAWAAFSFFGKRRRDDDDEPDDELLAAAAASTFEAEAAPGLRVVDESLLPSWRRPSLQEVRRMDPRRQAFEAPRLSFEAAGVEPLANFERRNIGYRLVRLLDSPDEYSATEIGIVDQGDEVQLLERRGVYWLVLCPDGRQGWVHRMTLAQPTQPTIAECRSERMPLNPDCGGALDSGQAEGTEAAAGLDEPDAGGLLEAYLRARGEAT